MKVVTDQTGRQIELSTIPLRIVSLVPSITELLVDLNLEKEIVGITKFCIHPSHLKKEKLVIGGTKNIKIDKILSLHPDLVIANKEENEKHQIEKISENCKTYVSEISNFDDAINLVFILGKIFNKNTLATELIEQLQTSIPKAIFPNKRTLYLIWRKPFMAVGGDTYIHDMLTRLGLSNCCANNKRYPSLETDEIAKLNPDYVFLSSEPYPFKEKHKIELQRTLPDAKIFLVDGEAFSWYGTRILKLENYFEDLKRKLS